MKPAVSTPHDPIDTQLLQLVEEYKKNYTNVAVLRQLMELGMTHERYALLEEHLTSFLAWGQQQPHFLFMIATVQERQLNYAKAASNIHKIFLDPSPKSGPMYDTAIRILMRTGEVSDLNFLAKILENVLATEQEKDNAGIMHNLCEVYRMLGRAKDTIPMYEEAIARQPFDHTLHFSLALVELMLSNISKGFDHYDHRFQLPAFKADTPFLPWAEWKGESLKGKKIYLWTEQGAGDMAMWAGMLPWFIEQGAIISCAAYPKLISLLQRSFPTVTFLKRYSLLPNETLLADFDYHCPMGNAMEFVLPKYTPAKHGAYLVPDKAQVEQKRAEYLAQFPKARKLVGVSWYTTAQGGWRRSIDLADMHPLLNDPEAAYISLQYNQQLDDVDAYNKQYPGNPIHTDLSFLPYDDMDMWAAQFAAMDHVVTIQNSAAHMAGSLGIPATLLLPAYGSWHWGNGDAPNHWYASVDVRRQKPGQSWASLIADIAKEKK